MKKKIVIVILVLIVLLFPIRTQYKDGGTIEYKALLYRVIKWHNLDNNYDDNIRTGTEFHLVPMNFKPIDYFMNTSPQRLELYYNEEKYYASTLSYNWCNEYENCTSRDVLLVKEVEFNDAIEVSNGDTIKMYGPLKVRSISVYKDMLDNKYDYDIEYNDEYLKVPNEKGNYAFIVQMDDGKNNVEYLFKVIVR